MCDFDTSTIKLSMSSCWIFHLRLKFLLKNEQLNWLKLKYDRKFKWNHNKKQDMLYSMFYLRFEPNNIWINR